MLCVQATAQLIIAEKIVGSAVSADTWEAIRSAVDAVDLGMDLAWDLLFGTSMVVGAVPMLRL